MKTLIFGLGNPIVSDDAVGLVVARAVHARVGAERADLVEAAVAGLGVLDLIAGYDKVVVIDAIQTKNGRPGDVYRLLPSDLRSTPRLSSPHDVDFAQALELGKHFEQDMPAAVTIYAIEVADPWTFSEALTPEVEAHVPAIVDAIVEAEFSDGRLGPGKGEGDDP